MQRAVLVLRYFEDRDDDDIASLLGCAPATVRVHAARGLRRLRAALPSSDLTLEV
jgi:DNA-directed RNA polymerase specialized sigma24 family protein